ncbi:EI24 domain-containing protein [Phaeovulum sp.]|uniref:EI24 domain-containing protein n=1 Tax=Phaeovulum sp. TaxID=2934796 RepID=UPI0039E2F605
MILGSFLTALGDLLRASALKILALGIGLSLALLVGFYAGAVHVIDWLTPDTLALPWIGEVTWVKDLMSWGSLALMLVLSFFLMIPVASAFTGLFLDTVANTVEARHYPHLPPARDIPFGQSLQDSLNFLVLILAVNIAALLVYLFIGPAAPLLFWAVNGYLLGREYFQMVAQRRLDRPAARTLYRANRGRVFAAGVLMAVPLSIPVVNLVVPVLGAATFTHFFHRLRG